MEKLTWFEITDDAGTVFMIDMEKLEAVSRTKEEGYNFTYIHFEFYMSSGNIVKTQMSPEEEAQFVKKLFKICPMMKFD